MKKIIITFAIIFISTSSVFSQSLNSISKTDSLKTKDTIINATKTSVKSINQDSYFTFSSGLMHYDDNKNIFYTSLDLNINTVYIFYIDLGLYGLLNKSGGGVALHGTAGIGLDIVRDKLFASAGAGYFYQVPFYLANIVSLRVNYKFSKSFSAGLDNKFIFNWKLNYHRNIYSIGLNVSYDLDN